MQRIRETGAWTQGFRYDGFGNLREQDAVNGVTPEVLLDVNMWNNRMSGAGWAYDGNGNTISMPVVGGGTAAMGYDVDNRLMTWTKGGVGTEEYRYLPDNKRVWKKAPNGTETVYFYGAGGQKLGSYNVLTGPFQLTQQSVNVYFGGKRIREDRGALVEDRLGDEIAGSTAGNVSKCGTYHRDQTTGLDYADQRYFTGLQGRYLSEDPCRLADRPGNPVTWSRYTYVLGDPVNFNDPSGLMDGPSLEQPPEGCGIGSISGGGGGGGVGAESPFAARKITQKEKDDKQEELIGFLAAATTAAKKKIGSYPKYLKVVGDFYDCVGTAVRRNISYKLFGRDDQPWSGGAITERLFPTDFDTPIIDARSARSGVNWTTGLNSVTFEDEFSNGPFGVDRQFLQSFTVQVPGLGGIPGFVDIPLL